MMSSTYVGMDVHQKSTVFCLYNPEAVQDRQFRTRRVPTTPQAYEEVLKPLEGNCSVAYEVGPQVQWVAAIVRPLAAEVQVANAARIPWLFRDGRKNDRLDARKLATLLYLNQLPTVHLPPADISAWRALINYRRALVKRRTGIKNQVRSILRTFGLQCPYRSCWTRRGIAWLRSLTFDHARNLMAGILLQDLARLNDQLHRVEQELDAIAKTHPNVALLRTIPGIGPRTAEAIVAFTDVVRRFPNRKAFGSYFGMTPTEDTSAERVRFGHISKRGPSVVRWVLVEAVHQAVRHCPALATFFDRIHRGKKDRYKIAIVATGRKILTICYAMMRYQIPFDPAKVGGSSA